jgi:twitching motility protein PilT
MAAIDTLLAELLHRGGSDLHLTASLPPRGRISGSMEPIGDTPFTQETIEPLLREICPPHKWGEFT